VLDTLHIIELPPSSGGYPEFSCNRFEPFVDAHHVVSEHLGRFLRERWQVPAEKIHRIYLNVDERHFVPDAVETGVFRRQWGIPPGARVVAFVGRFVEQKQPLVFVEMAERMVKRWNKERRTEALHFVMAGDGPLNDKVRRSIRRRGLTGVVTLTGALADTRPLYGDADVVVLCSENEGLALVAYEAMAMEKTVVSTDVGGQSELVPRECLVSNSGTVAETLAESVWPFLTDARKRGKQAQENRDVILRDHRVDDTFAAIRALYGDLLAGKHSITAP